MIIDEVVNVCMYALNPSLLIEAEVVAVTGTDAFNFHLPNIPDGRAVISHLFGEKIATAENESSQKCGVPYLSTALSHCLA